MKSLKSITLVLLIAFVSSGCYTQLEYSQRVKKITDRKPVEEYTRSGEAERATEEYYQDEEVAYSSEYEDEAYVPVYYKDYEAANWWSSCNCNPYSGYSYGTSYYYDDPWYGYATPIYRHYSRFHVGYAGFYSPYHYSRWKWRHFGLSYHHGFVAFGVHWGSPYHYYWDYPYYSYSGFLSGPYWGGYYYRPYWYGSYYGDYYGHGKSRANIRSRSYRPRSIGTDRVSGRNRGNDSRIRTENRAPSQKTRVRSTGSTRVNRGAVQRGNTRVQQPRTRGTNRVGVQDRSNTRERSRSTIQDRSQTKSRVSDSERTRGTQSINRNTNSSRRSSVGVSRTRIQHTAPAPRQRGVRVNNDRSQVENRISRQRAVRPDVNSNNSNRSSFLGRVKKIFDTNTTGRSTQINRSRSNNSSVRSNVVRQRSSSRSISKPRSSTRSSVSRSTSSSSRSRGTSGSSRSSSSRSRGNN